jgi:prevent-host-death family protein
MRSAGIHEVKTRLSELVRDVEAGEEILITRGGRPVAKLVSAPSPTDAPRPVVGRGLFKGRGSTEVDLPGDEEHFARLFGLLPVDDEK